MFLVLLLVSLFEGILGGKGCIFVMKTEGEEDWFNPLAV